MPDLKKAKGPPPMHELAGPSGARAGIYPALMLSLILLTALLVAVHTWFSVGGALLLMLIGAGILTRYVQRVSWTRGSAQMLDSGLTGALQDLSITEEAHDRISSHDLPLDNPTRPDIVRMEHQEAAHGPAAPAATEPRIDPGAPASAAGAERSRTPGRRSRPGRPLSRRLHLPHRRPGGRPAGSSPERQSTGVGSGDPPEESPRT